MFLCFAPLVEHGFFSVKGADLKHIWEHDSWISSSLINLFSFNFFFDWSIQKLLFFGTTNKIHKRANNSESIKTHHKL